MEILRLDPKEHELAAIDEDDEFYEGIEAPKFVDFTVPERSRPDDKSWFCLRIGCDQQHEEVDPDALYRSFLLRVMSARSPNVKLHRALHRPAPRSIKQCPRSAPAKSVKDRVPRLSTMTSVPNKMANTKLEHHPIFSLRSTPTSRKAKVQASASEKKALTTPRTRKGPSNHEPFRSVRHQNATVATAKSSSVAKALFLGTPKKNDVANKTVMSEACDGMKKLNIGTAKKQTPGGVRPYKSNKCVACNPIILGNSGRQAEETICMGLEKRIELREVEICINSSDHREVKTKVEENLQISSKSNVKEPQEATTIDSTRCDNHEDDKENIIVLINSSDYSEVKTNVEEHLQISSESNVKEPQEATTIDSTRCDNREDDKENIIVLQTLSEPDTHAGVVNIVEESDDNKENDSSTSIANSSTITSENGSMQFQTSENIPQNEIRASSKKSQVHGTQAGKIKRTTNPKPFRLRTDERGILKEANLEKKIQLEAQKETMPILGRGDGMQKNGKPSIEKNKQTSSDGGRKAQPNPKRAPRVRFVESRYATSTPKGHKVENKEQGSQKMIMKAAASSGQTLTSQSAPTARKVKASQLRERETLATKTQVEDNNTANATCPKGKRPSVITRKSTIPRFHV